ncbi:MAG: TolC family protein [Salinivirgaceae bacterium]|nr:TolC family protein [Salinivirgaceae bacterium]
MQKQLIIGILMAIAPSTFGANASDSVRTMTLKECMEYAVSNSTKIRIREAAVGDAQIARRDAILSALTPQIDAGASAGYNFGRSIDPQTNTYFNTTSFSNNYNISAGITLFNGFQAVNNMRVSKTSLAISRTEREQNEAEICLAVMEAYYNVVYYCRLCQLFDEQIATARTALEKMRRQEELGQKSRADVIQLEADLADREYDLVSTRQMRDEQIMNLSDLMFFPMDEQFTVDTTMPMVTADTQAEEDVVNYALGNNPDVKIAGWRAENAKRELSTAKWQMLPRLSASAGWGTGFNSVDQNDFNTQLRNHAGESIGLSLSIPIFNRLNRYSEISRKKNSYIRATAELDQKNRETESAVRKAFNDCNTAMAAYQQACKKTEIQQEAYQLNQKRMEQGLISGLEYQTAVNNYLKAKSDNMNSLFTYLIKQSVLKYYSGIDYVNQ